MNGVPTHSARLHVDDGTNVREDPRSTQINCQYPIESNTTTECALRCLEPPLGGNSLFAVGSFWEAGGGNAPALAQWVGCPNCYANCDGSTVPPVLNVEDFTCFINKYARNDPYANCDGSTTQPILNVEDFSCFISRFVQGCP
jgi:hypothetical protein